MLNGLASADGEQLFLRRQLAAIQADDAETAVGHVVVGILAHDDHALADPGLELVGEPLADDDAGISRAVEIRAFDDVAADGAEPRLGGGVGADQGDAAGLPLAGDDRRHADAGRDPLDAQFGKARLELGGRERHEVLDARIVSIAGMMHLNMARQRVDAVADHVVHHAAHQRSHEDHRPRAEADGREHDERAPVIAPEIAPGQQEDHAEVGH